MCIMKNEHTFNLWRFLMKWSSLKSINSVSKLQTASSADSETFLQ